MPRALPLLLATALALVACEPRPSLRTADARELWRLSSRGVALVEQNRFEDSAAIWREVLALAPDWVTARINLGIATLNAPGGEERALAIFDEVLEADPTSPWAHYCRGLLLMRRGDLEESIAAFRAVLEVDPEDPDTHYWLGRVHQDLRRTDEAVRELELALAENPNLASAWYALSEALALGGDEEGAARALAEFEALRARGGATERDVVYGKMGFYAEVIREFELPLSDSGPPASAYSVRFALGSAGLGAGGARHGGPGAGALRAKAGERADPASLSGGVAAHDLDLDGDVDLALANWGAGPDAHLLWNDGAGAFADRSDALPRAGGEARTIAIAAADLDGDGLADLFLGRDGADRAIARPSGRPEADFERPLPGLEESAGTTAAVAVADFDQDGDLDLALGGDRGVGLHAWDGSAFAPRSEEAAIDVGAPTFALLASDFDGDGDVDLTSFASRPRAWRNDRLWSFAEVELPGVTGSKPLAPPATAVTLADVDSDGAMDLLATGPDLPPRLVLADPRGGYAAAPGWPSGLPRAVGSVAFDADRDGDRDVLLLGEEPRLLLNVAEGRWRDWTSESGLGEIAGELAGMRGHAALDLERDGDLDLVVARNGRTPLVLRNDSDPGPPNDWIGIVADGIGEAGRARGRSLGVGARVEVRSAGRTHVDYPGLGGGFGGIASQELSLPLAGGERADLRIQWPDGVLQSEFDLAGGRVHRIEQVDREASSCPLLFYWDGERFAYRTDFLGVGGLGFLLEPGAYGPPDPEEVVRIGSELGLRDGRYELRLGEPMEEATYLDEATLVRLEHPAGTEAYAEERFATAEPLASGRPLVVATGGRAFPVAAQSVALSHDCPPGLHAPVAGRASPRDDRAALAAIDREFAGPFEVHRRLLGFAAPWATELAFDARALGGGDGPVHLYLSGWIEYPYSRLNLAAHQGGLRMEAWSLEVPDRSGGEGGWRAVAPELGYPAGKPRTMAYEVTPWLGDARDGDLLRLRLRSNLAVFVDRAFLARDLSARPGILEAVEVHPREAELRFAGFPREYSPDGAKPHLFDYANRDRTSEFKALAGRYSELGDVLDLVTARDDRFAIFGRGEEVALRFDPADFPEPADGARVTWFLRARGYCKDMCPLTAAPTTLEPLPFAAMENYPPAVPLGPEHPSRLSARNTRVEPERAPTR